MSTSVLLCISLMALALATIFLHPRPASLSVLRGPTPSSYVLGHEYELTQQSDVGDLEFRWFKQYGSAIRIYGCFSEHVLMIADPLGLQHILHSPNYPKSRDIRLIAERVFGRGILWATDEGHQRHRRALSPAFSAQHLRRFLPLIQESTGRFVQQWNEQLQGSSSVVFNMTGWIRKVTLDVIGQSAFDFNFGLLDGTEEYNELYRSLRDMFLDSPQPSAVTVLYSALRRRLPMNFGFKLFKTKEDRRLSDFLSTAERSANVILKAKKEALAQDFEGSNDKDILSVLVRSSFSGDPRRRLSDDEIVSQMATIILAGHETSASTMCWILYELSKNIEAQSKVSEEITGLRNRTGSESSLTSIDYDSLPYFNAVIKETLRLHPILPVLTRDAARDDVIPLSIPVKSASGEILSHIRVAKGQRVLLPLSVYNRLSEVWGNDADSWNPARFFSDRKEVNLGVYANLASFSGGIRSCIGWQFAVIELQVMLFGLIESFEFSLPPGGLDIQRVPSILMVPMIRGRPDLGVQLPLSVKQRVPLPSESL